MTKPKSESPPELDAAIRKLLLQYSPTQIRATVTKLVKVRVHDEPERVRLAVEEERARLKALPNSSSKSHRPSDLRVCESLMERGFKLTGIASRRGGGRLAPRRFKSASRLLRLYSQAKRDLLKRELAAIIYFPNRDGLTY
jgi:hypothetical protein